MASGKFTNLLLNRALRSILIYIGVAAYVIIPICSCTSFGLLVETAADLDGFTSFAFITMLVCGLPLQMAAIVIGAFVVINRRGKRLDEGFAPIGLEGRSYMINGRKYAGEFNGFPVRAKFYRGPNLDFQVKTNLGTRVTIGTRTGLGAGINRIANREPLQIDDPAFDRVMVFSIDETWARAFLSHDPIRTALLELLHDEGPYELRQFFVAPNQILFRLARAPITRATPENVQRWFDLLTQIATAAQALPAPTVTDEPNTLERW